MFSLKISIQEIPGEPMRKVNFYGIISYIYNPLLCMNGEEVKTLGPPNSYAQTEHRWLKRPGLCSYTSLLKSGDCWWVSSWTLLCSTDQLAQPCTNAKPSQLTELQKRFYVGSGNIPALFLYVCISFLWSFAFPCEILNDYLSF